MAVTAVEKPQYFSAAFKPSVQARDLAGYLDEFRRQLKTVHVQGAKTVHYFRAPWAGVLESVRSVQQIAGGGGGAQNVVDVSVGPTFATLASCYALAADGNNLLDNAAAGTEQLNFPTAIAGLGILTACSDGELRTKFNKGDLIAVTSTAGAAALGTVEIIVEIAREMLVRV